VRAPRLPLLIRSPLPRWFFDFTLGDGFSHGVCQLDVGVVQRDSLSVDLTATCTAYGAIAARRAELIAAEVAALAPQRPRVVLADIPALAFDVAAALGIPGIGLANFSWDWIYADYATDHPGFRPLVTALRDSYARATLLLRLPMHGELDAFPRIRDVPLVARRATLEPAAVRTRLGLPADRRLVLLSFGGLGLALDAVPAIAGVDFLATAGAAVGGEGPRGARLLGHDELRAAGVRYEDLVAAVDVVMTKPGYGMVAECITNRTPIVYTARGRFAEYDRLVAGITAHTANAFIGTDDLRAGRWAPALERAWSMPMPAPIAINGAEVVAEALAMECGA
jgi:L-arabinokinase